jgi:D-alanine-D-alanine ligase
MKRIRIAVIMGGRTAEHDISRATGAMVLANLDRRKYRVKPVVISRDGRWHAPPGYPPAGRRGAARPRYGPAGAAVTRIVKDRVECAFIAMHGPYGEDGTIQGMLEILDIPYTGSDVCASALAMDKIKAKEIYRAHGIPTPSFCVIDARDWRSGRGEISRRVARLVGFPCFLKPSRLGSSVGISVCASPAELARRAPSSLEYGDRLLAEKLVEGLEVTCAVLDTPGGRPPVALPPTEIVPRTGAYFDYHAKYTPGASVEITPARIGAPMTARVQDLALRAHAALGCAGMSRTDMIVRGRGLTVLETNTIPGMTKTSLLPQAARAAGLSFPRLLDRIIAVALEGHRRRRRHTRTR